MYSHDPHLKKFSISVPIDHSFKNFDFIVCSFQRKVLLANGAMPFTRPIDAGHLPGTEQLFTDSLIARENIYKLMEKLRPIWEGGSLDIEGGQIAETFTNENGMEITDVKLDVDENLLNDFLKKRIANGVDAFFHTVALACHNARIEPQEFHILLTVNSCKSALVKKCFDEKIDQISKDNAAGVKENIIIYSPLLPNSANPEAVTLKTGVAIGLLQTLDGEPTGIVMRHSDAKETPFQYYVGPNVQGKLEPKLKRNDAYGQWQVFGKATRKGKTIVLYTLTPKGGEEQAECGIDCMEEQLDFGEGNLGRVIMVQPLSPTTIVFGLRDDNGAIDNLKEIVLEN